MKTGLYLRSGVIALLMAGGGCNREHRDFHTGGPAKVRSLQEAKPSTDRFFSARGPQTHMEANAYAMSEGKRLYTDFNCTGCHANGGGDIGPPLMDKKWIYGARPEDIYASILDGRPNGMPAFRGRINETQARQLTAYVRSLSGQATENAAPSREDHMKATAPENSADRQTPVPDVRP